MSYLPKYKNFIKLLVCIILLILFFIILINLDLSDIGLLVSKLLGYLVIILSLLSVKRIFHYRYFSYKKIMLFYTVLIMCSWLVLLATIQKLIIFLIGIIADTSQSWLFKDYLKEWLTHTSIYLANFLTICFTITLFPYHWAMDGKKNKHIILCIIFSLILFFIVSQIMYGLIFELKIVDKNSNITNMIIIPLFRAAVFLNLSIFILALYKAYLSSIVKLINNKIKLPVNYWTTKSKKGWLIADLTYYFLKSSEPTKMLNKKDSTNQYSEKKYLDIFFDKNYKQEKIIYFRLLILDSVVNIDINNNYYLPILRYSGLNQRYFDFEKNAGIFPKNTKVKALWLLLKSIELRMADFEGNLNDLYSKITVITSDCKNDLWKNILLKCFGDIFFLERIDDSSTEIELAYRNLTLSTINPVMKIKIIIKFIDRDIRIGNYQKAKNLLKKEYNLLLKEIQKRKSASKLLKSLQFELEAMFSYLSPYIDLFSEILFRYHLIYKGIIIEALKLNKYETAYEQINEMTSVLDEMKNITEDHIILNKENFSFYYHFSRASLYYLMARKYRFEGKIDLAKKCFLSSLHEISLIWINQNSIIKLLSRSVLYPDIMEYYLASAINQNNYFKNNPEKFMGEIIAKWAQNNYELEPIKWLQNEKKKLSVDKNHIYSLIDIYKSDDIPKFYLKILTFVEKYWGKIDMESFIKRKHLILQFELQSLIYLELGALKQADIMVQRGIEDAFLLQQKEYLIRQYFIKGLLYECLKDYKKTYKYFIIAIKFYESWRINIQDEKSRINFFINYNEIYDHIIQACIFLEKIDESLEYVERSKSRTLSEILINKNLKSKTKHESELTNKFDYISSDVDNKIEEANSPEELESIVKDININRKRFEADVHNMNSESIVLQNIISVPLKEIMSIIPKHSLVIDYYMADEGMEIFTLDDQKIEHVRCQVSLNFIRQRIEELRISLESRRNVRYINDYSKVLYDILMAPIENRIINKKQLIIIPHLYLHLLPFALLRKNHYLIEDYQLIYNPNLFSFKFCMDKANKNSKENSKLVAFASPEEGEFEKELKYISDFFENPIIKTGSNSSKENFYQLSSLGDFIHIACHGEFNENEPLKSCLHFSYEGDFNNYLFADNIFDLNLNSKLVTLSACETGLSKLSSGEDLIGFVRAFMFAGTSNLLVTLWKVPDLATYDLMKSFYKRIIKLGISESLRQAQLELLNHKEYSDPYFWAGSILFGASC